MGLDLSVLIVSHNSDVYLESCLGSIPHAAGGLSCEIIAVDNASEGMDGLPARSPKIHWVLNRENIGWGAAVNQGARFAKGEILVLLNPDTKLLPGALAAVQMFFQERKSERLGLVGGRLLFEDGSVQPSCGPFPRLAGLVWRLALPRTRRKNYLRSFKSPARVDWVSGAFMAVKKAVFEELGGLDPGFFLYYEDVDLCLRANRLGLANYYLPSAQAYHYNPHAARKDPGSELGRIIQESRLRYFNKHRPAWETWALRKLTALEQLA